MPKSFDSTSSSDDEVIKGKARMSSKRTRKATSFYGSTKRNRNDGLSEESSVDDLSSEEYAPEVDERERAKVVHTVKKYKTNPTKTCQTPIDFNAMFNNLSNATGQSCNIVNRVASIETNMDLSSAIAYDLNENNSNGSNLLDGNGSVSPSVLDSNDSSADGQNKLNEPTVHNDCSTVNFDTVADDQMSLDGHITRISSPSSSSFDLNRFEILFKCVSDLQQTTNEILVRVKNLERKGYANMFENRLKPHTALNSESEMDKNEIFIKTIGMPFKEKSSLQTFNDRLDDSKFKKSVVSIFRYLLK